jgi:hypothetical protein
MVGEADEGGNGGNGGVRAQEIMKKCIVYMKKYVCVCV